MKKSTIILIVVLVVFCIGFAILYLTASDPVIIAPGDEKYLYEHKLSS